ncbi:thioredoxin [Enterococcus alcedinis]|uniref:Thioredoxin n=1 Tax=Enterococcus alcedinis TaxID=1274384 RepID=A0A917JEH7_9ENTE|nr:thioredoxin [Enterococcus alcedinis]MBP2101820.1 thioredoxin 1 [Enterococcus alcedinis]GGI65383.1 thioredoxin [Enterococcus alcedinis]
MNNLTTETFDQTIATGVHLVDFWAPWCGPCRMQNPILDELTSEMTSDQVQISKINVDEQGPLAARFGIQSIPTLLVFKDGQMVERLMGVQPKQKLQAVLNSFVD